MATSIAETIPSAASGVSRPKAKSSPLDSAPATISAMTPGALKPMPPSHAAVPFSPPPPNQPSSFCEPCAKKIAPITTRRKSSP